MFRSVIDQRMQHIHERLSMVKPTHDGGGVPVKSGGQILLVAILLIDVDALSIINGHVSVQVSTNALYLLIYTESRL